MLQHSPHKGHILKIVKIIKNHNNYNIIMIIINDNKLINVFLVSIFPPHQLPIQSTLSEKKKPSGSAATVHLREVCVCLSYSKMTENGKDGTDTRCPLGGN